MPQVTGPVEYLIIDFPGNQFSGEIIPALHELLDTGLTRARSVLHIAGSADVVIAALSRHASRVSGLAWRLAADFPAA